MNLYKSIGRYCWMNASLMVVILTVQFCLNGCCRCDQSSEPYEIIDRPRRGAATWRALTLPGSASLNRARDGLGGEVFHGLEARATTGLTPDAGVSGTFSIVAVDPNTGVCGAAVASRYPAVGKVVPYARAGVGAFCTQHWHNPAWGARALDMLAEGQLPEQVLAELLRDDQKRDKRQLAIIDISGRAANRNPSNADPSGIWWGAASGRYYACQGNTLAGQDVVFAMAKAYEQTRGSLADRLMAALIAGDCAGGDHRGRLAAGIRVARKGVKDYWLELYVDKSDDAVVDLAKKYAALEHDAKGQWRGGKK